MSLTDVIVNLWNIKRDLSKFYNKKKNYCGTYERQAFFTKWIPIQKYFPGINKACYYHDARYSIIFKTPNRKMFKLLILMFKLLILKLIVDIIFYLEMLKYSVLKLTIKSPFLFSFRLIIATLFFCLVVLGTPYYIYLFKKRIKKEQKRHKIVKNEGKVLKW